jgi:hypothetical protein
MADATETTRLQPLELILVTAFAVLAGLAITAFSLARHAAPDFVVFWTAARHAWDPLLYNSAHLTAAQSWEPGPGPRPFVYPPTFLLLVLPFGLLPFTPAYFLWVALSCSALVLAARRLVRPSYAAAVLPLCFPVMVAAAYGQSTLFAGAGLVAGVSLLEQRPALAGALIVAAASIKPQLAILSPILLLGHWRALGAGAATGLALVLASLVFGPARWLEWLAALPDFARTVRTLPLKFIDPLSPALALPLKLVVIGAGVGFALWNRRRTPAEQIVGLVGGSLCCTLYAVRADVAVLAPSALAWTLGGRAAADWIRRVAGVALIGGLVGSPLGVALFLTAACSAGLVADRGRAAG